MPSNVRSKLLPFSLLLLIACNNGPKETTEAEKTRADSLSRVQQRLKADSVKKTNPLLIVPPDSNYTGTYIDRYTNGIVKYRGFFRMGKRHGQWLSFFPSGEQWSEMNYEKGLRHGPNITFYNNTKIRYTGFYKDDLRDSLWQFYDSTGHLTKKVTYRKNLVVKSQDLP